MSQRPPCSLCDYDGLVRINADWFCLVHVDEGFRLVARAIAIVKGMDPDAMERVAVEAMHELKAREGL